MNWCVSDAVAYRITSVLNRLDMEENAFPMPSAKSEVSREASARPSTSAETAVVTPFMSRAICPHWLEWAFMLMPLMR